MIKFACSDLDIVCDENTGSTVSVKIFEREILSENSPLFEIALRDEKGGEIKVKSEEFTFSGYEKNEGKTTLSYRNDGAELGVSVDVSCDEGITARINVYNSSKENIIEYVTLLPFVIKNNLKGNGGSGSILWGFNEGGIIEDMEARQRGIFPYNEPKYPSEGTMGIFPAIVETQMMAYMEDEYGLYLATHDNNGEVKGIDAHLFGSGIKLRFRQYTGLSTGEDYSQNYDFVMKPFEGVWQDAAEIYRKWFYENHTCNFVKINDNDKLPEWYADSPLIITYPVRGAYDTGDMSPNALFPYVNAMPYIEKIAEETKSRIMVILMHWEGTAPWAPPYVWPPMGGEEELKRFRDELHNNDHILGVYCSGLGWTMQSNLLEEYNKSAEFEEKNLKDIMCLSPEGDLPLSHICTAQRQGYDMCPTQEFTHKVIIDQVEKMVNAGIDYVQVLDQNHGGTPYFCYSRNHGHPYVPGRWQTEAMRELLSELEEITHKDGKKVLLGCESAAAETYFPYLMFSDNRYELNLTNGSYPVPLYSYIYHEYINNFMGNQICEPIDFKKYPFSLRLRLAYSYTAGDMLTVVMDQKGNITEHWGGEPSPVADRTAVVKLIEAMQKYRRGYGKKYLHSGKMIKPYMSDSGINEIELDCGYTYKAPRVYTSCWTDADGDVGQIFVNYNDESLDVTIYTDRCVKLISDSGEVVDRVTSVDGKVTFSIDGCDVVMTEFE